MDLSSNRISEQGHRASSQRNQGTAGRTMQGQSAAPSSSLSDYGKSRHVSFLSEGEIIKGEVTDLRNTEIEVTLENNTHVSAKLEEGASLSIGDTAAFKVTLIEKGEITLKALPKTPFLQELSTIRKALDEAGLPKNDKNIDIVRQLMKEGLPINRNGIQSTIRLTCQYPDISLSTLLQIEKYHLPLNYDTALMLENLKEGNLSLPAQLEQFSEGIYELFKEPPSASEFFTLIQLLSNQEEPFIHTEAPDYGMAPDNGSLYAPSNNYTGNTDDALERPFYFSSPEDQHNFLDIISNFTDVSDLEESINQGSMTLKDAVHAIIDGMNEAMEIDANNIKLAMMEENTTDGESPAPSEKEDEALPLTGTENSEDKASINFFRQLFSMFSHSDREQGMENADNLSVPATLDLFDHPVIHHVLQAYEEQTLTGRSLYHLLNTEELAGLSKVLNEVFPDSFPEALLSKVRYGEASVPYLMNELSKQLKQAPFPLDSQKGQLLYSHPVLQKLISKSLFSSGFLTPHDFYSKENVERAYQNTSSTLNILEHLLSRRENEGSHLAHNLLSRSGEIKSQLSFLSTLDSTLQYIQLPLCLKRQNTKGELYVYTKKQALREHPDSLSVLLHLDMENLGPMDISLKMESNHIQAVFNLNDNPQEGAAAKEILSSHIGSLKTALEEKGFLLNSRFETKNEPASLSSFMEEPKEKSAAKRYSFDIRA